MPKLTYVDQVASTYPSTYLAKRLQDLFQHKGHWRGAVQREVAKRIQVHDSILSMWVRGTRPVPGGRIPGLAAALEMTVEELLYGVATPPPPPPPPPPEPVVVVPVRPVVRRLDVFCLLCARGIGPSGLRAFVRRLPRQRHCLTCGGFLLVEDVTGGMALVEERLGTGPQLFDDAALERATG